MTSFKETLEIIFQKTFIFALILLFANSYITYELVHEIIQTLAITLIITSTFTVFFDTPTFIEKITNILKNIVIEKDFLVEIDPKKKETVLKNLLSPSKEEISKYSNIEDYYTFYAEKTLNTRKNNVRSDYSLTLKAYFRNGKIVTDGIYSYRLHPSEDGFEPILVGFTKDCPDNKITCLDIYKPNNDKKTFDMDKLKPTTDDDKSKEWRIEVDDYAKGEKHLHVNLKTQECGQDHWQLVNFKAMQPTDGFKLDLTCYDGIEIKEYLVFGIENKDYHYTKSDDFKNIEIICNKWVDRGMGIAIVISKKD